jgi:hypothetical protein
MQFATLSRNFLFILRTTTLAAMRYLLFAFLLLAFHPGIANAQRSFLSPSFSTTDDEMLIDYAHPSPNRLIFTAAVQSPFGAYRWSDGLVFITDNNGALVRQRIFEHNGDSSSFFPAAMFTTDTTVELIGMDGYSVFDFAYPIVHGLRWIKMDTSLNVIDEKLYPLAIDRETIHLPTIVRMNGYTYATYNQRYYYDDQDRMRLFVLRFDKEMNLITKRQFNPSFYGTTLNVNGGWIYDISAHEASGTLFIPAEIHISSSTDSFWFPNERILHRLDTALNLLDTFIYQQNTWNSNGYDTVIGGNGVETLPLDEHRVWIGPVFMLSDVSNVFKTTHLEHVGLSLFNTTTGKYRHTRFAPNYDTSDRQSSVAHHKSMAQDGAGHVYAVGGSNSAGDVYDAYDNALVLVKYDTSGALLWHRFITSGSGFFYPSGIYCDGDSIVTILAMRYDHAALWPNVGECDYYVVRLRAADGATLSIFPVKPKPESVVRVFPNPTTGRINIDAPAGSRAQLFAPDGRLVGEAARGAKQLDLTGFAPSIYFLRVTDSAGVVIRTERVVKVD